MRYLVQQNNQLIKLDKCIILNDDSMQLKLNYTPNPALSSNSSKTDDGLIISRLILTSLQDLRIIDVEIYYKKLIYHHNLEFSVQAFNEQSKEILVMNPIKKTLNVITKMTGNPSFIAQKDIILAPEARGKLSVNFKAPWIGTYEGLLELIYGDTGEKHMYNLKGHVTKPGPLGTLEIECTAMEEAFRTFQIKIKNPTAHKTEYSVLSDLAYIYGNDTIKVD